MTEALRDRLFERRHSVINWPGYKPAPHAIGFHFDRFTGKRERHVKSGHKRRVACIWRKHLRARGFWMDHAEAVAQSERETLAWMGLAP